MSPTIVLLIEPQSTHAFIEPCERAGNVRATPQPYGRRWLDIRPEPGLRPAATIGWHGVRSTAAWMPLIMSVTPQPPLDLKASPARGPISAPRLRRAGEVVGLGIVPMAVLVWMFVVGVQGGPISGDFHHELYPEAKLLLRGENPFPSPDTPIGGANFVWPPVAAYLVSPLTLLPVGAADIVMVAARPRVLRPGPLARRSARLACVRCRSRSGRSCQRDARLASDAGARRAARGRLAVEGAEGAPGVLVGLRRRRSSSSSGPSPSGSRRHGDGATALSR